MLHCDDAGISREANAAILKLVAAGRVASLSVLANAPEFADFCKGYAGLPTAQRQATRLFLHFNLVEFAPLSQHQGLRHIVRAGQFTGRWTVIASCLLGRLHTGMVADELSAQLDCAQGYGLKIVGIDSHQHMHALNPVGTVVAEAARQRHISLVRCYGQMRCQTLLGTVRLGVFQAGALATNRMRLPVSWRGDTWQPFAVASWERINQAGLGGIILVCHPGAPWDRPITPSL
jgi:predicted glycoside hydrolase/deacetylase ChbG (UPF0249 family)